MMKRLNREILKSSNSIRKVIMLMVMGLMCASSSAFATCSWTSTLTAPYNEYLNYGSTVVQRDAPVGTVIKTPTISPAASTGYVQCQGGETSYYNIYLFTVHSSMNYYYNTNIPGVGIMGVGNGWLPYYNASTCLSSGCKGLANKLYKVGSYVLVKTGNIPSGTYTLDSGLFVSAGWNGFGDIERMSISPGATITSVACSLNNTTIQVPLQDVLAADLTSVGTTAKPKDFDLGLNCDTGARINVMMTGNQNTDTSAAGVLQLTGVGTAGVATGVGIQVLYNNTPLALNNNIVLNTSAGGQETFTFTAQYYQTKLNPTVGMANAMATLNITYQ